MMPFRLEKRREPSTLMLYATPVAAVALTMIAQRGGNPENAARLSGMSQSVGYVMGALAGPLAVGLVHDAFGGWPPVAVLFVVVTVLCTVFAVGAGRVRTV